MAKPKTPRKSSEGKPSVSPSNTPPTIPDSSVTAAVAPAVALSGSENAKPVNGNGESKKTEVKKTVRKPEIVKSEPRTNLVPINLEDEIRRLAYLLSERRGFEPGHEAEDWMNAEREIRQRYHQQSASASAGASA